MRVLHYLFLALASLTGLAVSEDFEKTPLTGDNRPADVENEDPAKPRLDGT